MRRSTIIKLVCTSYANLIGQIIKPTIYYSKWWSREVTQIKLCHKETYLCDIMHKSRNLCKLKTCTGTDGEYFYVVQPLYTKHLSNVNKMFSPDIVRFRQYVIKCDKTSFFLICLLFSVAKASKTIRSSEGIVYETCHRRWTYLCKRIKTFS